MLIRSHQVPAPAFTLLAHGLADVDVMRLLRAGRLSKQVLLVRAVVDATRRFRRANAAARMADAVALLDEAQRVAPETAAEVLGDPLVGAWAATCLRRLRRPRETGDPLWIETAQLAAVAAAAGVRAGLEFALPVPMRHGSVSLPTLGRARFGSGAAWGAATVRGRAGTYRIEAEHATVELPVGRDREAPGWEPVHRLTFDAAGWTLTVLLDDVDPYRSHGMQAAPRLDAPRRRRWRAQLGQAWEILVRDHPERAEELAALPITVVPLADTADAPHVSATTRDSVGAMALSPAPDPFTTAMSLVHELQHSKLGALLDLVELYDREDRRRFYSPWRPDPRPIGGLLQAAYAFLAVTRFWGRYATGRTGRVSPPPVSPRVAEYEFARGRGQVHGTLRTIADSGALTAPGARFVAGLREAVDGLADVPVAADTDRLARLVRDDHRVRWRLRNLRVDPAALDAASRAWRASAVRPPDLAGAALVSGGPPVYAPQPLREPVLAALADPASPGTGIGAALVTGDNESAAWQCLAGLRSEPGRADLWAALVLARQRSGAPEAARGYADRPELLVALHGRLAADGVPADPDQLAAWLAR